MSGLEKVLAAHNVECTGAGEVTCRACRDLGWMSWREFYAHQAQAVSAWLLSDETVERAAFEIADATGYGRDDTVACARAALTAALTEGVGE